MIPATIGQGHKSHASLDEPPSHQHPHARLILSVAVLHLVRLFTNVERLLGLLRADQAVRSLVEGIESVE